MSETLNIFYLTSVYILFESVYKWDPSYFNTNIKSTKFSSTIYPNSFGPTAAERALQSDPQECN